jgi:hypothetical protein
VGCAIAAVPSVELLSHNPFSPAAFFERACRSADGFEERGSSLVERGDDDRQPWWSGQRARACGSRRRGPPGRRFVASPAAGLGLITR